MYENHVNFFLYMKHIMNMSESEWHTDRISAYTKMGEWCQCNIYNIILHIDNTFRNSKKNLDSTQIYIEFPFHFL